MLLRYLDHPDPARGRYTFTSVRVAGGAQRVFPLVMPRLSVPDSRRNGVAVDGTGDGGRDRYAGGANPRDPLALTYTWRVLPNAWGVTPDALRSELNRFIDHGLPQTLIFEDDDGNRTTARGKLRAKDFSVDAAARYEADWTATWGLESTTRSGLAAPGVFVFGGKNTDGTPITWGQAGLVWGASPYRFALTGDGQQFTLQNPDATADTTDISISIRGGYGASVVGGPYALGKGVIRVENRSVRIAGAYQHFDIAASLAAADRLTLNIAAHQIRLNGLPAAQLVDWPATQAEPMRFVSGDNDLRFYAAYGGNGGLRTLAGEINIEWLPQFGW